MRLVSLHWTDFSSTRFSTFAFCNHDLRPIRDDGLGAARCDDEHAVLRVGQFLVGRAFSARASVELR